MDIYTLTSKFLQKDRVNNFASAIWTERYFTPGEVQIVLAPTPANIDMLRPGTFLWRRGGKSIMLIETHQIKDNLLTVTGFDIVKFLNERLAWFLNPEFDGSDPSVPAYAELTSDVLTAGEFISQAVDGMVISATTVGGPYTSINLDWAADDFPGLILGPIDVNGPVERFTIPIGQLYDGIQRLGQDEGLGLKLYLQSASYDSGFVFKFATYRGKDRTSDNPNPEMLVRLTPKMDALTDVEELRSISNYTNVFYVQYRNEITTHYITGIGTPTGFARRVMLVQAPDIYIDPLDTAKVAAFRSQTAKNAMAQHIYIEAVDGNVSSKIPYVYGVDFGLGDVIELQGFTQIFSKARVVEYIYSEDQFGEEEYPTLAVLDPDFIGTIPDLEPDEDFPEWYEDPDFDLDLDDDIYEDPEHEKDPKDHNHDRDNDGNEDPNPEPEPDFDGPPVADFTWEVI